MGRHRRLTYLLLAALLLGGCKSKHTAAPDGDTGDAPRAKTPDRVAPGSLLEGDKVVFGFRAPHALQLRAQFRDAAHFEGRAKLAELEDYVRTRVIVRHVEVTPARTVFPRAKIRGGDPERLYQFELTPQGSQVQLVIRDVTPPPTVQMSEEERWRQAGLTPKGQLLNPNELE